MGDGTSGRRLRAMCGDAGGVVLKICSGLQPHNHAQSRLRPSRAKWEWAMASFTNFLKDESGTTAIEYALIGVCISVGILIAVQSIGGSLSGVFEDLAAKLP